jgi:hypothetical protein
MDTQSANRCRCFRGSKLLINHEVHEGHEAKANSERSSCSLCPSWLFLASLGALFKGGGLAVQIRERFAGEME